VSGGWLTFCVLLSVHFGRNMSDHLELQLERRKIKPTAMRLLVLDFFKRNDHAISLKDLENGLESTDRVTLFRTLKTFEEHKVIHSIDDGSGAMKYAICGDACECDYPRDAHVHFHCRICNETQCLPKVKVPPLALPVNFVPEEANVVVKGICARCKV
jgi:Fur family ferric uptake transcriptional regulator